MCRFAAYLGKNALVLDDILAKPENSLIQQSHKAREGTHGVNADGFGIAWYNQDISPNPGIFKSIQPAWNDNNLQHLSAKIRSTCFLAHIRATTVGDVSQHNCHPFSYGEYALVHNGTIRNFDHYKKKIIDYIDENLFLHIKGNTDSEHFFFLVMHFVQNGETLLDALKQAICWLTEAQKECDDFSRLNIVLTDGNSMIATRFASEDMRSLSLKYHVNNADNSDTSSVILSSEDLDDSGTWLEVPENHYIHINKNDMALRVDKIG